MKRHTPEEFLSRMANGELPEPVRLSVVGMVKTGESAGSLQFTTTGCETWLDLPIEAVESFAHIKHVPCKEHQHPLVIVRFKPADELPDDISFFVRLCMQLQDSARRATSGTMPASPASNCAVVQGEGGLIVCCYEELRAEVVCTGMV